jgi:hypothetical protein
MTTNGFTNIDSFYSSTVNKKSKELRNNATAEKVAEKQRKLAVKRKAIVTKERAQRFKSSYNSLFEANSLFR